MTSLMAPPPPSRRARTKADTRVRILEAAQVLFAARGYEATTLRDLTAQADIGLGTFFTYFPTKEHLLATFYGQFLRDLETSLGGSDRSLKGFLNRLAQELAAQLGAHQSMFRGIVAHLRSSEALQEADRLAGRALHARIASALEAAQSRGEIRPNTEPQRTAELVLFALNGSLFQTLPDVDPDRFLKIIRPHLHHLYALLKP